jgi:hypothetical protein
MVRSIVIPAIPGTARQGGLSGEGIQEPQSFAVAPSARPPGRACLGQALDPRLRGGDG